MRFTSSAYLFLLLLLVWFWQTSRGSENKSGPAGHHRFPVLRCLVAALLVLALSGFQVAAGQVPLSVMFVVDVSDSMDAARAEMHRRLDALVTGLQRTDRAGLVVFGATAVMDRALDAPAIAAAGITADPSATATDIEAGLRLARTALPPTGLRRIVLLSDGQQTQGDALREASIAAAEGIAIDVAVPADDQKVRRFVVSRLSAPSAVAVGEPFEVSAIAEGPPGERGELIIQGDDDTLLRQEVHFSSVGLAAATHLRQEREAGVYVYRAGIRPLEPDAFAEAFELSAGAVVIASGKPRVLYVSEIEKRPNTILSSAFDVHSILPGQLPRSSPSLAPYDAVVLDDVSTDALDEAQVSALEQHVESRGSGLLMLGSARSLDSIVLPDRGLGKLLPVDLRPRAGRRAPELAIVIVFDKSGSMDDQAGGVAKIELARQGVHRVLEAVAPTDAVGVIAFDSRPTTVAPLGVGHDSRTIGERLRAIEPSGSTAMAPAVRLAREWLSAPELARFPRHHILLVTDGRSSRVDSEQLQALVGGGRFQLSVISLGEDRERRLLASLATSTGGRAYFPEDARDLPKLVAREAARVAGGRVIEETFVPRASLHAITSGIETDAMPQLSGYVVSAPKPTADAALSSHRDDPILATWRYGLGKVAVYTADLHSGWSTQLRASSVFVPMMTQMMRWLARSATHESLYARTQDRNGHVQVIVDAHNTRGSSVSLLDLRASIRRPSGQIDEIGFTEGVPGRYEARIPVTETGAYVLSLDARSPDRTFDGHLLRGFYSSADSERRAQGVNHTILSRVAQTTGGTLLGADGDPFSGRPPAYQDLTAWLLSAAFLGFLAELLGPTVSRMLNRRGLRRETLTSEHEAA